MYIYIYLSTYISTYINIYQHTSTYINIHQHKSRIKIYPHFFNMYRYRPWTRHFLICGQGTTSQLTRPDHPRWEDSRARSRETMATDGGTKGAPVRKP